MAVGTLASRLTGFLRTIVQNAAFGVAGVAAAYNLSNTLPNVVYNLALGGILTSVIVPLIVNASKRDSDRGQGYDQRMFTLITAALLAITVVAMLAAVPIVHLYAGSSITDSAATIHLAVIFALFFIPQIFFYGVSSLIGAILNSRGSFAAPMWTPIVNNFVVIAVLALYVVVAGKGRGHAATITGGQVYLAARARYHARHHGPDDRAGARASPGRLPLAPARRFPAGRGERDRPDGLLDVRVHRRHSGRLPDHHQGGRGDASLAGLSEYNYAWLLFQRAGTRSSASQ